MKKLTVTIGVFFALLSCKDLNLNPLSQGSSENWYSDETEVVLALNKLYHIDYWENYYYPNNQWLDQWVDSWSDDWTCRDNLSAFTGGTLSGQTDMIVKHWQNSYQCIQEANQIIENIGRSKLSEDLGNRYEAEARFARASQYAKLVFHFGDVPFYKGLLSIDEAFNLTRSPKEEILQNIYEDYDFASVHLPLSYGSNELQRATKGAAFAMKARIALYMGDYALARDAAQECINLDRYRLYSSFSELFGQKNSMETIFAIPRSVELNNFRNIEQIVTRNTGGFSTVQPSWDLFFSFLCTDGLPVDESPLFDPRKPFKNRDPRCAATIVPFGSLHLGVVYEPHPDTLRVWNQNLGVFQSNADSRGVGPFASYNGLAWRKWLGEGWYSGNRGDMDNIVIRYADVLLMYAEAKIELNEIDASVLDAINTVRARAYKVAPDNSAGYPRVSITNQGTLRKAVRIERRMELAFEGRRYSDIIRWKLADKVLNREIYGMLDPDPLREKIVSQGLWFFPTPPIVDEDGTVDFSELYREGFIKLLAQRKFDATRHYLWPLPTKEILINRNLSQNTGY